MEKLFTIRFGDTDPYGVVYYATYHRWAHQAVEDFLRNKGFNPDKFFRDTEKGIGMPVVASSGRFIKPVRYPASVSARVLVSKIGKSSITFSVVFNCEGQRVAEVSLTFVAIDKNWKKIDLPEEYSVLGGES